MGEEVGTILVRYIVPAQRGLGMLPCRHEPPSIGDMVAEVNGNPGVVRVFMPRPVDQERRSALRPDVLPEPVAQDLGPRAQPGVKWGDFTRGLPRVKIPGLVVEGLDPVNYFIGQGLSFAPWATRRKFERRLGGRHGGRDRWPVS